MTSRTPLVLLVEDDADHAELVVESLEEHAAEAVVVHVRDGAAALTWLRERAAADGRPDVVLLDLRLPRVDGLEVLRQVKADAALRALPVVVLTSSGADGDLSRAYALGANAYLVKPLGIEAFDALLRDVGTFWLERNRRPVP